MGDLLAVEGRALLGVAEGDALAGVVSQTFGEEQGGKSLAAAGGAVAGLENKLHFSWRNPSRGRCTMLDDQKPLAVSVCEVLASDPILLSHLKQALRVDEQMAEVGQKVQQAEKEAKHAIDVAAQLELEVRGYRRQMGRLKEKLGDLNHDMFWINRRLEQLAEKKKKPAKRKKRPAKKKSLTSKA